MGKMNLMNYLCRKAYPAKKEPNPSACQTCTSPCDFGRQWLAQLGMDAPKRVKLPMISTPEGKQHRSLARYINRGR